MGAILTALFMAFSGITLGLIKAWAFGLTLFIIMPIMMATTTFTITMLSYGKA
jgi:hypothetical protein